MRSKFFFFIILSLYLHTLSDRAVSALCVNRQLTVAAFVFAPHSIIFMEESVILPRRASVEKRVIQHWELFIIKHGKQIS